MRHVWVCSLKQMTASGKSGTVLATDEPVAKVTRTEATAMAANGKLGHDQLPLAPQPAASAGPPIRSGRNVTLEWDLAPAD